MTICACGRIARVKGLCFACYAKQYRQKDPEKYRKEYIKSYQKVKEKRRIYQAIRWFFKSMDGQIRGGDELCAASRTTRHVIYFVLIMNYTKTTPNA